MLPITFPEFNDEMPKPRGWTDEQCMSIPVWKGMAPIDDIGTLFPAIVVCYKLAKEDLEEIQKTGVVWLQIIGETMPPVAVYTENPFINE